MFFIFFFLASLLANASSSSVKSDLNQAAKDCRHSESQVAQLESDLKNFESLYHEKTEHLKDQQKKIGRILILLRNLESEAPSKIIQSEGDSDSLLHNFSILKCYIRSLHKHIHGIRSDLLKLKETKEETSKRKASLDTQLATYKKKYNRLETLLKQKKQQVQETINQRKSKEKEAKKLAERSKNLADLVKHLEKNQAPSSHADSTENVPLLAPVQSPLIVKFGQKNTRNPDASGVVFRTRSGAHVLAPISGKVLYAGSFRRYKKILIIGFHKSYFLLLTGLDRLDVSVGQEVKVGDPTGCMAKKGKSYLYLELRKHGIPVKPHIMKT